MKVQYLHTTSWRVPLLMPAYEDDAGYDLYAAISGLLQPGRWVTVPTGIQLEIPPGYVGEIRPRSGLASRSGITVLNAPGTIDAGYRGEVGVVLMNHGHRAFPITLGDRIAQLLFLRLPRVTFVEEEFTVSERLRKGFGSSG